MFETPGEALDVGVGAGRDTAYLLRRGWRVTALDSSPSAAEALERLAHSNLRVVVAAAQDLATSDYDLVNAQFSLPFIPREHFEATVRRLRDSLRGGGVVAAHWPFFTWSRATVSSSPTLSRELRIKKVTLRPNEVDDA